MVSNTNATLPVPPAAPSVSALINSQTQPSNVKVNEPVDAEAGGEIYSHTDLTTGSGAFPYALAFGRTYQSSSNLTDVGMGNGWTHNYSHTAAVNSDPYEGLGASSPIRAANSIAAIYVAQNLLSSLSASPPSLPQVQALTLAWIVNRWFTDRLTNNSVLVSHPDNVEEFVALPYADGATAIAYNPPLGTATVLTGTSNGNAAPTTFTYVTKDGIKLSFGANPAGALSSWTYPNGMALAFAYNAAGQLTTVSNTLNRTLSLFYAGSHVASVSDGSRSVAFGYSGTAQTSASDPLGAVTRYAYDTSGTYDSAGHLTQIFYPTAPSTPFVTNFYDALGRVAKQRNANGQTSLFYIAGSRSELVDALGNRRVTYQTPSGQITKSVAVLSGGFGDVFQDTPQQNGVVNVASSQFDGLHRLVLATAPEGGTTAFTYSPDFESNVTTITRTAKPGSSLAPLTTTITYDPLWNKPNSITDPRGLVSVLSYDPATGTLLKSVADSGGSGHFNATSRFGYNGVGQMLTSADPLGVLTRYAFDANGNLTAVVADAGGLNQTSGFGYDALGNVTAITDPNGHVSKNGYDLDRRLTTSLGPATPAAPAGVSTAYTYDPDGRLLATRQSAGGTFLRATATSYTATGKPATTTDANGNVTRFAYDADDRLASLADPLGRTTAYGYDALGRRIAVSNAAILAATPLLQQTYTPDGLLASFTSARSASLFATTAFAYDGFDRLATTTHPDTSTQTLGYDADGNVTSRQTRKGDTIAFTYDTLNRLSTKAAPSEATATYAYDLAGRLKSASDTSTALVAPSPAGAVSALAMSYDALNNLVTQSWSPVQAQAPPSAGSSTTFAYRYDGSNRRVSQAATDASWLSYPAATASTVAYTANSLDQYTAVGAVTPTYDANGNFTFDGTFTYGYDAESRLISASGAGTSAAYAYDSLGHRKSATSGGVTTILVTDPDNRALLDYDGASGAVQRWYVLGSGPNALLNQVNVAAGTRATLIPDVQGSIVVSLDSGSGVLTKAGFQPYGESGATASSTFGYTGARIAAGGLYDMRARFYSPAFGRFLQADPIGAAGGVNLYAYVGNDPLNRLDPLGLCDNPAGCGFGAGLSAGFQSGLLGPSGSSLSSQLQNSSSIGFQVGAFLGVEAGGFVGAIPYLASRGAFSGEAGAASQAAESTALRGATTIEARGGTYVLRDAEGTVVRSGRTNDLARREAEHLRDPNLAEYQFQPAYRTDVYAEQRGLEQILHDQYSPALNKIRPISPSNAKLPTYMDAAQKYLLEHGGP